MIAIIVPFYNAADTLPQLISALKALHHTDFVVLFVDDRSTDDGASVIAEANDSRFIIMRGNHKGPGAARNIGLDKADELKAEYVAFVDADDIPHSEMLSVAKSKLERSGADIVHFEWNSSIGGLSHPDSIGCPSIHVWNKLYRRSAIKGIRFVEANFAEDVAFFIESECRAVKRVGISRALYTHVQRLGSLWKTRDPAMVDESMRKIVCHVNDLMRNVSSSELKRRWYGFWLVKLMKQWLRTLKGDRSTYRRERLIGFRHFLHDLVFAGLLNPFRVGVKNFRRCLVLRIKGALL